ncbi:hypothetical protein RJ639_030691 [Escallonia herrerae]|uniref:Uncharacterized protein n=1 Tax=Escallonia herrerae TaxID=1293975 RepID=A0AA89BIH3_9ASTE|nr:hypothetical protein RJ639_030691 [Escallonia herrerae]
MNRAQIGVLEQSHQVCLRHLLQRRHDKALEPQVRLEVLRDLANEPLERQLVDRQLSALLILSDLPEHHGSGPKAASESVPG